MALALFLLAEFVIVAGTFTGLIGYDTQEKRFVSSIGEYLLNLFASIGMYVAPALAYIWLYVRIFGWPQPE